MLILGLFSALVAFQLHATSPENNLTTSVTLPSCTLQITNGLVSCHQNQLVFTTGDSNVTIEGRKKEVELNRKSQIGSVDNPNQDVQKLYQSQGQCYDFAIQYANKPKLAGYALARLVPVNASNPTVGAVVVTLESNSGHLAVVTGVTTQTITVIERNYLAGWVTTRTIQRNAKYIKGYAI